MRLEVVRGGAADRSGNHGLFKELLERYHYLGYRVPFGASLRYLVRSERTPEKVLACLLWSSPAWRMAARDAWIGWRDEERARNLQLVVNNSRFLILPWVRVKGLASKILAASARQLPEDWEQLYGYRPLLLETLVDATRFRGTCYRAANWIPLGPTAGRGRMHRQHAAHGAAVKDLYVYPLCRRVRQQIVDLVAQPAQHLGVRQVQGIFGGHARRLYHWVENRAVPADNNRARRELRPTVIARKASFGSQSDAGAKTREVLMSVVHTLVKRVADPESHFKSVLDQLAVDPTKDPVSLLLDTG